MILTDVQNIGVAECHTMASSDEPLFLRSEFGDDHLKELVSFYVRPNDPDESLFESAYTDFVEYVSSLF
ncbi:hypothetical protein N7474_002372 [Penicillium riverlandense]|uniref:uncharacterized protein n=1 Tax=Penicillium riverlandense TaxID=1903569 RepID=UPI002548A111|nr:uncharacterized protein N7474_002372 [Penicillium riverlandense]KAJ5825234.1 hypothetical protein N7474_002372 [Penicillium riverlandense]